MYITLLGEESILICPSSYKVSVNDQIMLDEECKVFIKQETLTITSCNGNTMNFSYREIYQVDKDDYAIHLYVNSGVKLTVYYLGHYYNSFVKSLNYQRNEMIIKDMLMNEAKVFECEGEYLYSYKSENMYSDGSCEIRLYETAIVLVPENAEIQRIPYCFIQDICEEDYTLNIESELGEQFIFSKMGRKLEPFKRRLNESINKLSLKARDSIKNFVPNIDSATISKVASLMKDGKAVKKSDIECISDKLWDEIESKIRLSHVSDQYDFLKSIAYVDSMYIGFKRGLMGELTKEYIWLLVPIYSTNTRLPGNLVAMESVTNEGSKATYFFRIMSRKDYFNYSCDDLQLHIEVEAFIKKLNYCMFSINFRREPIYLSDKQLDEPKYTKYKIAIGNIPGLRMLRSHFVGRVFHRADDQWKKDVLDLLEYNASTFDDVARLNENEK